MCFSHADLLTILHFNFNGAGEATDRLTTADASLEPSQLLGLRVLAHCKFGCHVAKLRRLMQNERIALNPQSFSLDRVLRHLRAQRPGELLAKASPHESQDMWVTALCALPQ